MGRVWYNQPGYHGCSMSMNAVLAYEDGEKPKSKWTKKAMLATIEDVLYFDDVYTEDNFQIFQSMNKDELFDSCFMWTSWHHTGKFANETDFYGVDEDAVLAFVGVVQSLWIGRFSFLYGKFLV